MIPKSRVVVVFRPAETVKPSMSWNGATAVTIGSFAIAATSSGVIVRSLVVVWVPTAISSPSTRITFDPSRRMLSPTALLAPALTAFTATSEPTPMITPSAVSMARNQFARSAVVAILSCSRSILRGEWRDRR